jgi:hypothetical protein
MGTVLTVTLILDLSDFDIDCKIDVVVDVILDDLSQLRRQKMTLNPHSEHTSDP